MRVDSFFIQDPVIQQKKVIKPSVEADITRVKAGGRLSQFEELQIKSALYREKETGFGPKLDARLAIALSAAANNNSETAQAKSAGFVSNQYINSSLLGQRSIVDINV